MQQLAKNMPQNLTLLVLRFADCEEIGDRSLQQLAKNMPQNLTLLSLNFRRCRQITDESVQQLAKNMPQNLTLLSLVDFGRCWQIMDESVQQLASNMPQNQHLVPILQSEEVQEVIAYVLNALGNFACSDIMWHELQQMNAADGILTILKQTQREEIRINCLFCLANLTADPWHRKWMMGKEVYEIIWGYMQDPNKTIMSYSLAILRGLAVETEAQELFPSMGLVPLLIGIYHSQYPQALKTLSMDLLLHFSIVTSLQCNICALCVSQIIRNVEWFAMGCGAHGSKRFPEAEVASNQLRGPATRDIESARSEGPDVASGRSLEHVLQELEAAKKSRIDAEAKVTKILAEDAVLREELERFEASASAEASRSSRLDGRCSVLEVESRTLRDELASSSNAHDQLEEVAQQLRRELAAKDQKLAQLQSQLQKISEEAIDFQAQRDYALSELKAANQVAEALKSTSTVLDKRRKPRRSRPNNEEGPPGPPGTTAGQEISDDQCGDLLAQPETLGEEVATDRVPALLVNSVNPPVSASNAPDLPWADTPDVNSAKAFGSFAETGEVVLSIEESPANPKNSEDPKIFSDPSAKVFQFDFSAFDFLKHEALRTPPDSPLEIGTDAFPVRSEADRGGLKLGAVEAALLEIPEQNEVQANIWSDVRWSTRV
eukprot:s637_g4.t1